MRLRVLPALTLLLAVLAAVAAPPPDGVAPALARLRSRAEAGDSAARYRLALVLESGAPGVAPDTVAADSLMRLAADAGYAPALGMLGFRYYRGDRTPRDPARAIALIERAALAGDPKAANNLGWLLLEGEGVEHDPAKAAYWFGRAADAGLPLGAVQLADMLATGRGIPRDSLRAVSLYEEGIRRGVADAELRLQRLAAPSLRALSPDSAANAALRYLDMGAVRLAAALLQQATADPATAPAEALRTLAGLYALGRGVPYDHARSTALYLAAARRGDPEACRVMAETLEIFPDALDDPALRLDTPPSPDERSPLFWRTKIRK